MLLGLATYYVYRQAAAVYDKKRKHADALREREAREKEKVEKEEERLLLDRNLVYVGLVEERTFRGIAQSFKEKAHGQPVRAPSEACATCVYMNERVQE